MNSQKGLSRHQSDILDGNAGGHRKHVQIGCRWISAGPDQERSASHMSYVCDASASTGEPYTPAVQDAMNSNAAKSTTASMSGHNEIQVWNRLFPLLRRFECMCPPLLGESQISGRENFFPHVF